MAKKEFKIAEPQIQLAEIIKHGSKYQIKEKGYSFYDIRNSKPIFAFDYLSLNGTQLCYDNNSLAIADYVGLLACLKDISHKTYQTLKETPNYRFHQINFDDKRVAISREQFKLMLVPRSELLSDDELPTLYQFDLNYIREARACGFLFKGVFYLVWFDRFHQIYPR